MRRVRILIADDSKLIRDRIVGLIGTASPSHIVEQAADGLETLEKSCSFDPDIVVLDIQMPFKNGLQVLEELSKRENRPTVLVFTNYAYPQYKKRCLSLGADRFFDKSTEYEEMFAELNRFIAENRNIPDGPKRAKTGSGSRIGAFHEIQTEHT
ncbi:MAG: response regulator [Proteobacteria bacterium]|nr:response regulator [Pseudomonadota bacterium]